MTVTDVAVDDEMNKMTGAVESQSVEAVSGHMFPRCVQGDF